MSDIDPQSSAWDKSGASEITWNIKMCSSLSPAASSSTPPVTSTDISDDDGVQEITNNIPTGYKSGEKGGKARPGRSPVRKTLRVSITFKFSTSWKGTKSRDFPGRTFSVDDRNTLHAWASDFRNGIASVRSPTKDDNTNIAYDRTEIVLPESKRKCRLVGSRRVITRQDAYAWFRSTHERLLNQTMREALKHYCLQTNHNTSTNEATTKTNSSDGISVLHRGCLVLLSNGNSTKMKSIGGTVDFGGTDKSNIDIRNNSKSKCKTAVERETCQHVTTLFNKTSGNCTSFTSTARYPANETIFDLITKRQYITRNHKMPLLHGLALVTNTECNDKKHFHQVPNELKLLNRPHFSLPLADLLLEKSTSTSSSTSTSTSSSTSSSTSTSTSNSDDFLLVNSSSSSNSNSNGHDDKVNQNIKTTNQQNNNMGPSTCLQLELCDARVDKFVPSSYSHGNENTGGTNFIEVHFHT
jgi:hypothetical protein